MDAKRSGDCGGRFVQIICYCRWFLYVSLTVFGLNGNARCALSELTSTDVDADAVDAADEADNGRRPKFGLLPMLIGVLASGVAGGVVSSSCLALTMAEAAEAAAAALTPTAGVGRTVAASLHSCWQSARARSRKRCSSANWRSV